jgi:MSHA biogenesis protein MshO
MRSRGFTIIELVMVIVITGIIAATVTIFFKPAVDSYFGARHRATLTDMADTALRRMGREVRFAVPNSVRTPNSQCFELIPASAGGRFREASDTVNDAPTPLPCTPSATCSAPLDLSQPATRFDSLSLLSAVPAVNDWVVIDNQNTNDVYAGSNRAQIAAVATPARATDGFHRITLSLATQFPSGYVGGRFMIVPSAQRAVFYSCVGAGGLDAQGNGTGTLYRVSNYGFNAAYPAACPGAGGDIVARRVRSCNFAYAPNQGATQQSGFVWMQIQLTEANETISLSYGAHVDNVP